MYPEDSTPGASALGPTQFTPIDASTGWGPLAAVLGEYEPNQLARLVDGLLGRFALPADAPWWLLFRGKQLAGTGRASGVCVASAALNAGAVLPWSIARAWDGYWFILFGVSTDQVTPEHPLAVRSPWGLHPITRLWMRTGYYGDPLEVERVWLPGHPTTPQFCNQRSGLAPEVWQRAGVARDLLVDLEQDLRGRPPGYATYPFPQDLRAAVDDAWLRCWRAHRDRLPTQAEVAMLVVPSNDPKNAAEVLRQRMQAQLRLSWKAYRALAPQLEN
jgi:hypothetical protein